MPNTQLRGGRNISSPSDLQEALRNPQGTWTNNSYLRFQRNAWNKQQANAVIISPKVIINPSFKGSQLESSLAVSRTDIGRARLSQDPTGLPGTAGSAIRNATTPDDYKP